MAKERSRRLKVYRTAIGFHDAYVAAPSQKAALEAWGSDVNLFARGAAEEETDESLTREPLARPGEVVKLLRGTEAEQLRALGKGPAKGKHRPARPAVRRKRPPRPSRAAVDKAESALEQAKERHREALAELRVEEEALAQRRRTLEARHRDQRERLERRADEARRDYSNAMAAWAED